MLCLCADCAEGAHCEHSQTPALDPPSNTLNRQHKNHPTRARRRKSPHYAWADTRAHLQSLLSLLTLLRALGGLA